MAWKNHTRAYWTHFATSHKHCYIYCPPYGLKAVTRIKHTAYVHSHIQRRLGVQGKQRGTRTKVWISSRYMWTSQHEIRQSNLRYQTSIRGQETCLLDCEPITSSLTGPSHIALTPRVASKPDSPRPGTWTTVKSTKLPFFLILKKDVWTTGVKEWFAASWKWTYSKIHNF
jgi:hypothetical protein